MLFLNILIALLFLSAGFLLIHRLLQRELTHAHPDKTVNALVLAALLLFAYSLLQTTFVAGGLNISFFNVFNIVAFFICGIYVITTIKQPVEIMGIIIFPISAVSIILSVLQADQVVVSTSLEMQTHILLSLIAYSILFVAAFQAIIVAIQNSILKKNPAGSLLKTLPALESMEQFLFRLITLGFILLTFSLFSGFLFVENILAQHLAHKTFFSLIAWIIFALLLWGRYAYGWRGKKAIHLSLWGFGFLMLAYFGSKFVTEFILNIPPSN